MVKIPEEDGPLALLNEFREDPGEPPVSREACKLQRLKRIVVQHLKRRPCSDCGQHFPTEAMDFDHRPGTKKLDCIAAMKPDGTPYRVFMDEIAKCDLVCSNGH